MKKDVTSVTVNDKIVMRLTALANQFFGAQAVADAAAARTEDARQKYLDAVGAVVEAAGADPTANWRLDTDKKVITKLDGDAEPVKSEDGAPDDNPGDE